MSNDSIFKFGYGDILVYHDFNSLKLYHIDIPQKIGYPYNKNNFTILSGHVITFYSVISVDKVISHLKDILIDKSYYQFEYNGVIFDFTNWNENSIQICIDAMMQIRHWFMIPLAA